MFTFDNRKAYIFCSRKQAEGIFQNQFPIFVRRKKDHEENAHLCLMYYSCQSTTLAALSIKNHHIL